MKVKKFFLLHANLIFFLLLIFALPGCKKDSPHQEPLQKTLQVWLHHVNTINKAQKFQDQYIGFELDVHFDTNLHTIVVKHDFADTTSLTLSSWLSSINDPENKGFWLDFKNLGTQNKDQALKELLFIRNAFGLTKKIIVVESFDPNSLVDFDTLNFRTSFYIPPFDPAHITTEEELAYKNFIEAYISQSGISTISGYSSQHEFMKKWFPEMNKLLWFIDSFDSVLKDSIIAETKKDSKVEVLLVGEEYQKNAPMNPFDPAAK